MARRWTVDTGGTLTTNLVSYYDLEDRLDKQGTNNLTENGSGIIYGAAKYGNGVDFGSANTTKWLDLDGVFGTSFNGNISFSFWGKQNDDGVTHSLVTLDYANNGPEYRSFIQSTEINAVYVKPCVNEFSVIWTNNTDTAFHHYIIIYNGSALLVYVDGTLRITNTQSGAGTCNSAWAPQFSLGRDDDVNAHADMIFDELGVWDKVLSATEISDLYNGGTGSFYVPVGGGGTMSLLGVG